MSSLGVAWDILRHQMRAFLLTWNPRRWEWTDLPDAIRMTQQGGKYEHPWSTGGSRRIQPGDRVFLFKQGPEPRVIVAAGTAISDCYLDEHWDENKAGQQTHFVKVSFEIVLPPELSTLLLDEDLNSGTLVTVNWKTRRSGIEIPRDASTQLEHRWQEHLRRLGILG